MDRHDSTTESTRLLDWGFDDIAAFGVRPHRARHRLHEQPLFTDDALAELLDRLPRDVVHPYTMGHDPAATHEWRRGELTELPGAELLRIVERGHLWLNIVGVNRQDPAIADLVERLYAEIGELVHGFEPISVKATLLISSPSAMVYYHADNQPNALWHLRGRKRAYVYPIAPGFISDADLEKLVAGATDEQLRYDSSYDTYAATLDLEPGEVAWWPQNSPHRVENLDGLNISLSTEHRTAASTQRERVWAANHHWRARTGRAARSQRESGPFTAAKIAAMRAGRKAGVLSVGEVRAPRPSFAIDSAQPSGVRAIPQ